MAGMPIQNPPPKKEMRFNYDRISSLPDCLLTHILSFLPIANAVRTSILSKRWRWLWTDLAALDMVIRKDDPHGLLFLDRVAALHAAPKMYKLHISVERRKRSKELVKRLDSLVRAVVVRHVESLSISYRPRKTLPTYRYSFPGVEKMPTKGLYQLPREVYSCGSLRELTTQGCKFTPDGIRVLAWRLLRVLDVAYITWSDDMVAGVLAGCPALESLRLRHFRGLRRVDVMSPNLKELLMDGCDDTYPGKLDLCIPHVKELTLSGHWEWLTPTLVNYVCSMVKTNLNIMYNRVNPITNQDFIWVRKLLQMVVRCEQLEVGPKFLKALSTFSKNLHCQARCLVVCHFLDIDSLVELIQCSPILERLIIHFPDELDYYLAMRRGRHAGLLTNTNDYYLAMRLGRHAGLLSNIKTVELHGIYESWFLVAEFLLKNLAMLEKMVIFSDSSLQETPLQRLIKSLQVLKTSAIVEIFFAQIKFYLFKNKCKKVSN